MSVTEVNQVLVRGCMSMRVQDVDSLVEGVLVNPVAPRLYFAGSGLIWKGIRFETNPTIAAAASMLIVLSILALIAVELARWQTRRRASPRQSVPG